MERAIYVCRLRDTPLRMLFLRRWVDAFGSFFTRNAAERLDGQPHTNKTQHPENYVDVSLASAVDSPQLHLDRLL